MVRDECLTTSLGTLGETVLVNDQSHLHTYQFRAAESFPLNRLLLLLASLAEQK